MSCHQPVPIDVCLLNGRPYVQGTQMIARAGELLDPAGARLVQAKFVRLTSRAVCALTQSPAADAGETIGTVQFSRGAEPIVYRLIELPHPAPQRNRATHFEITELRHDHALSGRFAFRCNADFEGVLDALIQGIKMLHESLGVFDVWFSGLRGFALPLDLAGFEGRGLAQIVKQRVLGSAPRHQSLLQVTLTLPGVERAICGLVSFAFRSGDGHVD